MFYNADTSCFSRRKDYAWRGPNILKKYLYAICEIIVAFSLIGKYYYLISSKLDNMNEEGAKQTDFSLTIHNN